MFPAAERLFRSSQSSDIETVHNEPLTVLQYAGASSEEYNDDIEAESRNPAMHNSVGLATQETINNSETNVPISGYSSGLLAQAVTLDSSLDVPNIANIPSPSSTSESDSIVNSTTAQTPHERSRSINELYAPIFGSRTVDQLLSHYLINIADLLLPILHENNPWRNLYMPTIFDAAAVHYFAPDQAQGKANSALYYAALSTSSFHIWYGQRDRNEFHRLGTFYRCKAMHSLQLAVSSQNPGTEYRNLLMAILSLVTNGV